MGRRRKRNKLGCWNNDSGGYAFAGHAYAGHENECEIYPEGVLLGFEKFYSVLGKVRSTFTRNSILS